MKHSIKPFLLDSILAWAEANKCTPILLAREHIENNLPSGLDQEKRLLFSLSHKDIEKKTITTEGLHFSAYFSSYVDTHPHVPRHIFLCIDSLVSIRIKETGQEFALDFHETMDECSAEMIWPDGIMLTRDHTHFAMTTEFTESDRAEPLKIIEGGQKTDHIQGHTQDHCIEHTPNKRHLRLAASGGKII